MSFNRKRGVAFVRERGSLCSGISRYKVVSHDVVVALRQVALLAIEKDIYRFRDKLKSPDYKFRLTAKRGWNLSFYEG